MADHASPDPGIDSEHAQAQVLVDNLEEWATRLEQQVSALEASARMRESRAGDRLMADARTRRLELYEVRHHIDALHRRYPPAAV